MHITKASRSIKKLFDKYHEPPTLSHQQSQKLLDSLKVSFRDQLDREYGGSLSTKSATTAHGASDAAQSHEYRHSAMKQHLKTLLSNPLFSYKNVAKDKDMPKPEPTIPTISSINPSKAPSLKPRQHRDGGSASFLPPSFSPHKRDPMDVFDHAVSKGMMDLQRATGCLVAKQKLRTSTTETSPQLSSADTGRRIIRWLRSSRPENDLGFLDRRAFINVLMPFLVTGGLDQVVWEWFARSIDDASLPSVRELRLWRASNLLNTLVRVKGEPQNGDLAAAMATLLQAEDLLQSTQQYHQVMVTPWRSVSWLSTVESQGRTKPLEKLYDAHMAIAGCLSHRVDVEQAHLQLYHPTHADSALALRVFESTQKIRYIVEEISPDKWQKSLTAMGKIRWMTVLGHDTVRFLTRSGRIEEAQRIAKMVLSELAPFSNAPNPT